MINNTYRLKLFYDLNHIHEMCWGDIDSTMRNKGQLFGVESNQ